MVPLIVMLLMVRVAVPEFLSVTVLAFELVKFNVVGKLNEAGDRETTGAMPVPLRLAVWGLPVALSLTDSVPVREPAAAGLNVTLIEQLAFTAKVDGEVGQLLLWAKSPAFVPVIVIPLMVSAAVPPFVSVTVCAALLVFTS